MQTVSELLMSSGQKLFLKNYSHLTSMVNKYCLYIRVVEQVLSGFGFRKYSVGWFLYNVISFSFPFQSFFFGLTGFFRMPDGFWS